MTYCESVCSSLHENNWNFWLTNINVLHSRLPYWRINCNIKWKTDFFFVICLFQFSLFDCAALGGINVGQTHSGSNEEVMPLSCRMMLLVRNCNSMLAFVQIYIVYAFHTGWSIAIFQNPVAHNESFSFTSFHPIQLQLQISVFSIEGKVRECHNKRSHTIYNGTPCKILN